MGLGTHASLRIKMTCNGWTRTQVTGEKGDVTSPSQQGKCIVSLSPEQVRSPHLTENIMHYQNVIPMPCKRKSPPVTPEMAAKIKALLTYGLSQQDIATICRVNQGRVSEVNTGMRFPGIEPAQIEMIFN